MTCRKIINRVAAGIVYFLLCGSCVGGIGLIIWMSVVEALRGSYFGLYLFGGMIVFCVAFVVAAYTDGDRE